MIDEVGELFGRSGDAARPRVAPIVLTLLFGTALLCAGMLLTVVPGAVVLLAARAMVDKEIDRLRNGFLPADSARTVRWLRVASTVALFVSVLAIFVQGWTVWNGMYASWMYTLIDALGLLHGLPDT